MEVEFSQHALDQLKVRSNIKKSMVLDALRSPDEVKQSYRSRQLYRKTLGHEVLEVVAFKESDKIIVVTEYFLEQ